MAATAGFLPGAAPFPRAQPSSSVGEPTFRGIALVSHPRGSRMWAGSVVGAGGSDTVAVHEVGWRRNRRWRAAAWSSRDGSSDGVPGKDGGGGGEKKGWGSGESSFRSSNYAAPLGRSSSGITRSLAEILRDLNKKVRQDLVDRHDRSIPWYNANELLNHYAPGWCGEVRKVIFSHDGSVTVIYRVTIRGSDGEAHRESTGTVSSSSGQGEAVETAEGIAFCRACARFGLGLYLYHVGKSS